MNHSNLAKLQKLIVKDITQKSYKGKIFVSTLPITKPVINLFGLLLRQKRIGNLKNLLPYTINYLKYRKIFNSVIREYLKNFPQRKIDYYDNATDFYNSLLEYQYKNMTLRNKVIDIANYEISIAKTIYNSDHSDKSNTLSLIKNHFPIRLDPAVHIIKLSYDIRPLFDLTRSVPYFTKSSLKLLICWDYKNNKLRIFELDQFNYQMLTNIDQLNLYIKFIGITSFWKNLIDINVMEITS